MQYIGSIPFFFWLHWVLIAVSGLSLVAASGAILGCGDRLLIVMVSLVVEHRIQAAWVLEVVAHELSSCGTQAQ